MRKVNLILVALFFCGIMYGQNINVQQSQQNVNINLPVIERNVYIDRFRVVYRDRPQPVRVARRLPEPVLLLGYLWVHTQDLGDFRQHPHDVIRNINAQNAYGRNNWRIPTCDELRVMENNANLIGLGDGIYMATSHSNGILRLVSTGLSVAEQNAEFARRAEEDRRIAEEQRWLAEQRAEEERRNAEEQRRIDEQRRLETEAERQRLVASGQMVIVNGVGWATRSMVGNGFASSPESIPVAFSPNDAARICPSGWRLPTRSEAESLARATGVVTSRSGIEGVEIVGEGGHRLWFPLQFNVPHPYRAVGTVRVSDYHTSGWMTGDDRAVFAMITSRRQPNSQISDGPGAVLRGSWQPNAFVRCVRN